MKLLLATLHSRYSHASLALPSLAASCSDIAGLDLTIQEYSVNERIEAILPKLAIKGADVVAFSCYIWNIEQTLKLISDLKLVNSAIYIILGGPEVSYGSHELLAANPAVDCIVRGEGEGTFLELARLLALHTGKGLADELLENINGLTFRSGDEIITTTPAKPVADLDSLPSPVAAGLIDTTKPLVYIETSRGCPFSCAFCISSIDSGVRSYSMTRIQSDLLLLMQAGVQTIKLVDRTFNFDAERANLIWNYILEHNRGSCFHFEIAADLLTDENIALLATVPKGVFRFEIGVQSTVTATLESVGRRSDQGRLFANIRKLKEETGVTLHLDLVAGLPEEDFSGFLDSLDQILAARPDHIQIEPLKVLKGTAMRKVAQEKGYAFSATPPYRILRTPWLSFAEICNIENIAERVELLYNSGRFAATIELLADMGELTAVLSAETATNHPVANNITGLFASFNTLLQDNLSAKSLFSLLDALRFDYCMSGHPGNRLPGFFDTPPAANHPPCPAPSHPEIAQRLGLSRETSFRTFTSKFSRNYSSKPWQENETVITFVYLNRGAGERVRVLAV